VADVYDAVRGRGFVDRFADFCAAVVRFLPFGLSRVVAPSFLGFALINGFTFAVDLLLLTLLRGWLELPVWLAISLAYATAFGLSFVLNRWMNFRSHAPVGRQTVLYVIAIIINYLAFILGVGAGLTEFGVDYRISRLIAGACEGAFMYSVMRWVVFAKRNEPPSVGEAEVEGSGEPDLAHSRAAGVEGADRAVGGPARATEETQ
jgi:putative flippase GtrA